MQPPPWGRLVSLNPAHCASVDLRRPAHRLGRDASRCDTAFPRDALVSGVHCEVALSLGSGGGGNGIRHATVADMGSANGTFVDGDRLAKHSARVLTPGCELSLVVPCAEIARKKPQVASTFISFIYKAADVPADPPIATAPGKDAVVVSQGGDLAKDSGAHSEGDVLAKYVILKELGEGNFASVHDARDRETGQRVAMKIVDKKRFFRTSALRKEQLTDEIEIMKACQHPNIVRVIDVMHTATKLYLALELCEGGDLFDAIVAAEQFDEARARRIFAQLASAVGYIHSRGIAHRDLKPENILLQADDQIKLSDFGLSRIIPSTEMMKTLCGTPQYLAPEIILQSEGKQPAGYTLAVDAWALGVVLYILLVGFPPFGEGRMGDIKDGRYDFEDERWLTVSEDAKDMVRCLLTVNPSTRATVDDIFSHAWLAGVPRVHGESSFINAGRRADSLPESGGSDAGSATVAAKRLAPTESNGSDAGSATVAAKRLAPTESNGSDVGSANVAAKRLAPTESNGSDVGSATVAAKRLSPTESNGLDLGSATVAAKRLAPTESNGSDLGSATVAAKRLAPTESNGRAAKRRRSAHESCEIEKLE